MNFPPIHRAYPMVDVQGIYWLSTIQQLEQVLVTNHFLPCVREEKDGYSWQIRESPRRMILDWQEEGQDVPFSALETLPVCVPCDPSGQVLKHLSHVSCQSPIVIGHRSRTRRLFTEQYLYSRTKTKNERVCQGKRAQVKGEVARVKKNGGARKWREFDLFFSFFFFEQAHRSLNFLSHLSLTIRILLR